MKSIPTIEEMIQELEENGWKRVRNKLTLWQSPDGRIYRGPYRAWTVLTGAETKEDEKP